MDVDVWQEQKKIINFLVAKVVLSAEILLSATCKSKMLV